MHVNQPGQQGLPLKVNRRINLGHRITPGSDMGNATIRNGYLRIIEQPP